MLNKGRDSVCLAAAVQVVSGSSCDTPQDLPCRGWFLSGSSSCGICIQRKIRTVTNWSAFIRLTIYLDFVYTAVNLTKMEFNGDGD